MNAFNDIAILKTKTGTSKNVNGFRTDTFTDTEAFCEIKSVTYAEFYSAYGVKLKVTKKIKIDVYDYEEAIKIIDGKKIKPSIVEIDGELFNIVRMYQVNDIQCELSLAEIE
ncbi:MAG: hypothetical protein KBT03_06080 [Bacteroidales bacterium]|nr:hypothetical protein [Candidatus Scybalousia scybalohippi]